MARANYLIDPEMFEYLTQIAVREPDELQALRERTQQMRGWGKILTAECGHFLRFLLRLTGAKRCLDVGTFTGFSALSMAVTIPDDGEVHTCEVDESRLKLAKANFSSLPEGSKITTHLGPAVDKLQNLLQNKGAGYFDFVFIDADKLAVEDYYQLALQLIKDNGLVVIDNVFWYKQVVDSSCVDEQTQAMRRFNLARSSLPDGTMTIVPLGDGLMLVQATESVKTI